MSALTHIFGVFFIMIWIMIMFMGDAIHQFIPAPYSEDLVRYKWLLLGLGVFLAITGFISGINKRRNDKRWSNTHSPNKHSRIQTDSYESQKIQHDVTKNLNTNDPILQDLAKTVEWSPLAGGGANFKTSSLKTVSPTRLEVVKSKGGYLFSSVFIGMGLIIPGIIAFGIIREEGFSWVLLFLAFFALIFAGVGFLFLLLPRPRIFDKTEGWFWEGKKSIKSEQYFLQLKKSARLSEIAAIQIVPERLSGKNSSYTSWEINLVSNDAKRLNVMDHGNKQSILDDAQKLGEFLDVPVWENV